MAQRCWRMCGWNIISHIDLFRVEHGFIDDAEQIIIWFLYIFEIFRNLQQICDVSPVC